MVLLCMSTFLKFPLLAFGYFLKFMGHEDVWLQALRRMVSLLCFFTFGLMG